jgi:hypothetical protein
VVVVGAIVLIGYGLRQESAEGKDPPEGDSPVAAVSPGATGAGRDETSPAGAARSAERATGGGAVPGAGTPLAVAGEIPAGGPAPSGASTSTASPDAGASGGQPGARGASGPSPSGATASSGSAASVDAGATPSSGSSSSAARGLAATKAHAASTGARVAVAPDAGAEPADAGRARTAVGATGSRTTAQAEAAGEPGAAAAQARDGGVVVASRAVPMKVRPIAGGLSATPAEAAAGTPGGRGAEGRPAPPTALERRFAALERSRAAEEVALKPVERFVTTGGVTLTGRVVDADGGKPIADSDVHVHHEGTLVEGNTDATGAFSLPGMVAGSHVVVWVGRAKDHYIDERVELAVSGTGDTADAGTLKLLRGDELSARNEGWVGLFIDRRGSQIVVAGVSPWTPADEAHLEVGDQVVSINGRELTGLGPRAVTYLLRGRVGTPVALVIREHGGTRRKLTLARVVR